MKILIADNFPPSHQAKLRDGGHEVSFDPKLEGDALTAAIGDHEILIVRSTRVDAAVIDAAAALKLVIRAGAGTNTIDKAHAAANDIRVCNVPGANALAVAELAMGLIIAIDRRIADNVHDLRNRTWRKKLYGQARGLYGRNLGILGLGSIGLALAERAHAFGINVHVVAKANRAQSAAETIAACQVREVASIDELLKCCDIVSLHLPQTEQTEKMVNRDFLAKMQDGAILINTSRGGLVDEAALIEAIDGKGIRAGLDVYQNEPASSEASFESALAAHPAVCGTHHIGASTAQAQTAVADGVLRVIESHAQGHGQGALLHCVN